MTNKELLELAAKAAEIKYDAKASEPHPKSGAFWGLWLVIDGEPSEYQRRYWNPLTDDGDALRLAVKLGLLVNVWSAASTTIVSTNDGGHIAVAEEHHYDGDPYAATRRAIVRAAASIGKTK